MKWTSPTNVVIGETYHVPCVQTKSFGTLPVLLPAHTGSSKDCLATTYRHYHIDWRFVALNDSRWTQTFVNVIKEENEPFLQDMVCFRLKTTERNCNPFAIAAMHERLANEKASQLCPHQGMKLVNSCGTCPAHGLVWDLESKNLKFVAPFFLRSNAGSGKICKDRCTVLFVCDTNRVNFEVVDANGNVYPNSVYKIRGEFKAGQTHTIVNEDCHHD